MCTSVPQMPVRYTRISTSLMPMVGSGISSIDNPGAACAFTKAFTRSPVSARGLLHHRRIPMLHDFAVHDAEHIEPGGGVLLAFVFRVVILAHEGERHIIAFGLNRHQARNGGFDRLRRAQLSKEIFESLDARLGVG